MNDRLLKGFYNIFFEKLSSKYKTILIYIIVALLGISVIEGDLLIALQFVLTLLTLGLATLFVADLILLLIRKVEATKYFYFGTAITCVFIALSLTFVSKNFLIVFLPIMATIFAFFLVYFKFKRKQ